MSGLPPAAIRELARKVLESMRGTYNVWSLDVTEVKRKNDNFAIVGKFATGMFGTTWISFTITIDKNGNVFEAKIGE